MGELDVSQIEETEIDYDDKVLNRNAISFPMASKKHNGKILKLLKKGMNEWLIFNKIVLIIDMFKLLAKTEKT